MRIRTSIILAVLLGTPASLIFGGGMPQSKSASSQAAPKNEFFIVSMVNTADRQLLMKRPTEVTVVVRVNDKTVLLSRKGKPLQLEDLRSGDTVFATLAETEPGVYLATRIQEGPMTVQELHRRYWRY